MNPEKIKENIEFPHIASELQEMADKDQAMRKRSNKEDDYWDEEVDEVNTKRMKEIISEIGFPTISKVGKEGSHNAWLLIQHTGRDLDFQKKCLELMKEANQNDVEKKDIAYLEDRIRVHSNKGQLYGTQFTKEKGKHISLPIENEGSVDNRRAEMGMDTLANQIKMMREQNPFEDEK